MRTPSGRKAVEERRLAPGTVLDDGRFRVARFLGEGSFGATYLVAQTELFDRPLVAKVLHRLVSPRARDLFAREARVLTELRHPAIPQIISYFEHDEQPCLVQEYVNGETLAVRIGRDGPMSEDTVREVLQQLCGVLAYLHGREPPIVHRDVKPDNLMIDQHGTLHLIDFGAVHEYVALGDPSLATVIGPSGGFSPHEVLSGRTVPASDMYMVGATGVFLLSGILPERMFDPVSAKRLDLHTVGLKASPGFVTLLSDLFDERVTHRPTAVQAIDRLTIPDTAIAPAAPAAQQGFIARADGAASPTPNAVGTELRADSGRARAPARGAGWRVAAGAVVAVGAAAGAVLWSRSEPADVDVRNCMPTASATQPARPRAAGDTAPVPLTRRMAAGVCATVLLPPQWTSDSSGDSPRLVLRDSAAATQVWVGADSGVTAGREPEWVLSAMQGALTPFGRPVIVSPEGKTSANWRFWKVRFLTPAGDTTATRAALAVSTLPEGPTGWWFSSFSSEAGAATASTVLDAVRYATP